MLHSGEGKSEAVVSVAGERGLGTGRGRTRGGKERRGTPPVAGGRAFTEGGRECTRIMEKRWRAQSRLARRAFAFARRVFAA